MTKHTIEIDCTDEKAAKYIQDKINGVYDSTDWDCDWCGHTHTDDRDYGDYTDKVEEYVGTFGEELTEAIDNKSTHEEIRELVEEWIGEDNDREDGKIVTFGLDKIDSKVLGDIDWVINVVHENCDGDYKCDKCGKENREKNK